MDKVCSFPVRTIVTPPPVCPRHFPTQNFCPCAGSIIRVEKLGEPAAIWCFVCEDLLITCEQAPKNKPALMIFQNVGSFIVCWSQLAMAVVDCCWDNEPGRDSTGPPSEPYVNEPMLSLNLPPSAVRSILNSWCASFTWRTVWLA